MFKFKIFLAALVAASFLTLPGCVWSKSSSIIKTSFKTSLEAADATEMPFQDESTGAAVERTVTAPPVTAMLDSTQTPTTAAAGNESIFVTEAAPITPESIAALPAGTIVDEFLSNADVVNGCFYYEEISDAVFARMENNSYKADCTVPLSDLRYVRVLYYGFDESVHIGELVVSKKIAQDMIEIFRGLYDAKYQIGKMVLVDDYGADDNLSMAENNTSAFNYRMVVGTSKLSNHALGLAIDVNPLYNPWIYVLDGKDIIDPPSGAQYADRSLGNPHYLDHDDLCYQLFIGHGFTWGGDWSSSKDYQHFSKTT
ncbi:MAG: M15 family metallopeptidase [Eubacteriales bacterium]